jgi:hypothetical protein
VAGLFVVQHTVLCVVFVYDVYPLHVQHLGECYAVPARSNWTSCP